MSDEPLVKICPKHLAWYFNLLLVLSNGDGLSIELVASLSFPKIRNVMCKSSICLLPEHSPQEKTNELSSRWPLGGVSKHLPLDLFLFCYGFFIFFAGGLAAVIYTDALQSFIMVAGGAVLMVISKFVSLFPSNNQFAVKKRNCQEVGIVLFSLWVMHDKHFSFHWILQYLFENLPCDSALPKGKRSS